jgi:hypothetical protein
MTEQEEQFEEEQRALNPHRDEQIQAAVAGTVDRLRRRGVNASESEEPEKLADLLSAIERFEVEVQAHGGDLFVDDLRSSEPDDPHFVLPSRNRNESTEAYIARIHQAREKLQEHPYGPDK